MIQSAQLGQTLRANQTDQLTVDEKGLARLLFRQDKALLRLQEEVDLEKDEWLKGEHDWAQPGWTPEKTALKEALWKASALFASLKR